MSKLPIWIEKLYRAKRYMSDHEHGAAKAVISQVLIAMEREYKRQRDLEKSIERDFVTTEISADEMKAKHVWMPPSNR